MYFDAIIPTISKDESNDYLKVKGEINSKGFIPNIDCLVSLYHAGQLKYIKTIVPILADPFATQQNLNNVDKDICYAIGLQKYPEGCFGPKEWELFYGEVGEVCPLPDDIDKILNEACPYWPGKKVSETHMLTFIPSSVNGEVFNIKKLGELVKNPLTGNPSQ